METDARKSGLYKARATVRTLRISFRPAGPTIGLMWRVLSSLLARCECLRTRPTRPDDDPLALPVAALNAWSGTV